ncbi:MAG: type II toxin-antitoxin system RelE/ParE family toxin [Alphaproteobacteria bacterium]|nr:type II toxin-antitoxin system RelE/ParE family toxin [Alphaproteobacteria bacterium]
MSKPIRWTLPALRQLEDIQDYIAEHNPRTAFELAERIRLQVNEQLPEQPLSGRNGRVDGTRELVISGSKYIVAYRVKDDVEILERFRDLLNRRFAF